MRTLVAFACLGLSLWLEPAWAQAPAVYKLRISADPTVLPKLLIPGVLEGILDDASKLLTIKNGCNVRFELDGPVAPFPAGTPKDILSGKDLEAVHQVNTCGNTPHCSDVKVVATIKFCKTEDKRGYIGCAWRENGPKTMIVTHHTRDSDIRKILWAHEFGHTSGLQHRDDPNALMSHCGLNGGTVRIDNAQCNCFRAGPGNKLRECLQPDPNLMCPSSLRRGPIDY